MNHTATIRAHFAVLLCSAIAFASPLFAPNVRADDKNEKSEKKDDKNEEMTPIDPKVKVCHNGHTITVSLSAVKAHLAHGDTLGECKESDDKEKGKDK